jgi:hypothetical protein
MRCSMRRDGRHMTLETCCGSISMVKVNLTVPAYNLKRACNLVGVNNLIAAPS